jgi:hypothetical protein
LTPLAVFARLARRRLARRLIDAQRSRSQDDQAIPAGDRGAPSQIQGEETANAAEPPKSEAVTKAPVTASKVGDNAHPVRSLSVTQWL